MGRRKLLPKMVEDPSRRFEKVAIDFATDLLKDYKFFQPAFREALGSMAVKVEDRRHGQSQDKTRGVQNIKPLTEDDIDYSIQENQRKLDPTTKENPSKKNYFKNP